MVKVCSLFVVNYGEIVVDWVLVGYGIVLCLEWDIVGYLCSGELVWVFELWVGSVVDIYVIYLYCYYLLVKVWMFIDFFVECFVVYWVDEKFW